MPINFMIFNLPEDDETFWNAVHGNEMALAIGDLDQKLRAIVKYNGEGLSADAVDGVDRARTVLHETLEDRGLLKVLGF